MSDYSRKLLEKYGWTEGKGLGKEENGITKPIKPSLKFNTHGIGHDSSKDLTSRWWCDVFNEASKRIEVENCETGVRIVSKKRKNDCLLPSTVNVRGKFVKAGTMTTDDKNQFEDSTDRTCQIFSSRSDGDELYRKCEAKKKTLTSSCMKGKLMRIHKQDQIFAKKFMEKDNKQTMSSKHKNISSSTNFTSQKSNLSNTCNKISHSKAII